MICQTCDGSAHVFLMPDGSVSPASRLQLRELTGHPDLLPCPNNCIAGIVHCCEVLEDFGPSSCLGTF